MHEMRAAYAWYVRKSAVAAQGFYDELFPEINQIQAWPIRHAKYLHDTRRIVLSTYRFL